MVTAADTTARFLPRSRLQDLVELLREDGRRVLAPTVADEAIVYDEIETVEQLPVGRGSEQSPGRFRLVDHSDGRYFDYAVGPTSWKRYTFPPTLPMAATTRDADGRVTFERASRELSRQAFLGVRACELAALGVQDRVFLGGPYTQEDYRARREASFVVAVQCAVPASTCFCTSMGTGPGIRSGHDLALIELDDGFIATAGSPEGSAVLERLETTEVSAEQAVEAADQLATVRERIGDPIEAAGLHDRLLAQPDSPRWAEVAERCTACANCTFSCPTCFCNSIVQVSDLDGSHATTERLWDSCFTLGFARVAGGNFRTRRQDRYRQWLTHKFATWIDQFGTSGCVGCGRCITWCPVGIDVREELNAIAPPPAMQIGEGPVATAEPHSPRPFVARVVGVHHETHDTVTLELAVPDPEAWQRMHGEFLMVAVPAVGSAPISISRRSDSGMELTIRAAGPTTAVLTGLEVGSEVGLTGTLGRGWPIERARGRDVIVVGGGQGLAPLRPLIDQVLEQRGAYNDVRIYYGARTPGDLLYRGELAAWSARSDVEVGVTVDRADDTWLGRVGIVTHLFDQARWDGTRAIAFVCGPERMMQASVNTLAARGLTPDRIYVSMERHMECGVGLCGHCQMGQFFICKDGPVFSLAELGDTFGREGI